MIKKSTEDGMAEFLAANPGVKPLKTKSRVVIKNSPALTPKPRQKAMPEESEQEPPLFFDRDAPYTLESDDPISYKHSSISNKILRKLGKGQYTVEAALDMHGMTVAVALHEVDQFLKACLRQNLQVVLLIHGKGSQLQKPILKNKLHQWLCQVDAILAFCSASEGRRGALVVLLKRKREETPCWTLKT